MQPPLRSAPDGGRGAATHSSSPSPPTSSPLSSPTSSFVLRRLVPLLLLFVAAAVLPAPTRPSVMTDFFASRELGRGVQCGYSKGGESSNSGSTLTVAAACSRAHSSAAAAASLSDFLGNSLALLVAPAFGRASDVLIVSNRGIGGGGGGLRALRSRFLSLALLSSALPPAALALHQRSLLSASPSSPPPPSPLLYVTFLFSALATAAPGAAICLACAADALPAGQRASAFAALSAAASAGLLLGSGAGAFLGAGEAAWLATAGVTVSAVLAAWLPEVQQGGSGGGGGRGAAAAATGAAKTRNGSSSGGSSSSTNSASSSFTPLSAFKLLTATPQASRLLACVFLSGAAAQGLSDTIAQFLQQRLSFGAADQALLLAVAGGGGLLAQAAVLPLLLSSGVVAGEAELLRVGLAASLAEHSMLVFSSSRAAALSAVGVGALGGLAFPAASALAADGGPASEHGAVQGALRDRGGPRILIWARSGAAAVGPLAFGGIYFLSERGGGLPASSFAGAPFAFGAALLSAALDLALKIGPGAGAEGAPRPGATGDPERAAAPEDGEDEAAPLVSGSPGEAEA